MAMVWIVSVLMVSVSLYSTGDRANPIVVKRKVVLMPARSPVRVTFLTRLEEVLRTIYFVSSFYKYLINRR